MTEPNDSVATLPFWWRRLKELVPEALWPNMVVAGGYAADASQASDIDVWILSDGAEPLLSTDSEMVDHGVALLSHLRLLGIAHKQGGPRQDGYAALVATLDATASRLGLPVQLLVSGALDAQELVDGFDISTHAVGIRETTVCGEPMLEKVRAKRSTLIGAVPRVLRWNTPESTLARLQKLALRYGVLADVRDLDRLSESLQEAA